MEGFEGEVRSVMKSLGWREVAPGEERAIDERSAKGWATLGSRASVRELPFETWERFVKEWQRVQKALSPIVKKHGGRVSPIVQLDLKELFIEVVRAGEYFGLFRRG